MPRSLVATTVWVETVSVSQPKMRMKDALKVALAVTVTRPLSSSKTELWSVSVAPRVPSGKFAASTLSTSAVRRSGWSISLPPANAAASTA